MHEAFWCGLSEWPDTCKVDAAVAARQAALDPITYRYVTTHNRRKRCRRPFRNQNHSWRSRYSPPRSSRMAWRQGPQGSKQHLDLAAAATRARTQRPRKYLAIHAAELAIEPNFQILRRYRRSLLLRLEHAHRAAVENHVHRAPRLGSRRSLNLRIGIICGSSTLACPHAGGKMCPHPITAKPTFDLFQLVPPEVTKFVFNVGEFFFNPV